MYLPYVYEIPDRHGNRRLYFWRGKGHPRIRIKEQPGTALFHQRYDELMHGKQPTQGRRRPKERSLYWLCSAYFASAGFRGLEKSTRNERRLIVEAACRELVAPGAK